MFVAIALETATSPNPNPMRSRLSLFTMITCVAVSHALATDRVVGPSSTYYTITSALASSSDGDRILVTSGTYNEVLSLSKSISLLPLVEGGRYTITQPIRIENASGKTITMMGAQTAGVQSYGTFTAPTDVRIVDSRMTSTSFTDPFIRVAMFRDTLSDLAFSNGTIAGCSIIGTQPGSSATVSITGATQLTDEVWIVGNQIGATGVDGFVIVHSLVPFHVENNYFKAQSGPSIEIMRESQVIGSISTILNNTFALQNQSNQGVLAVSSNYTQSLLMKNNLATRYGLGMFHVPVPTGAILTADHNATPTGILATYALDPITGQGLGLMVDAGDPDPRYLDLDLTTNDIGCYGGSNSRANFTTPMGGAVVGFMQVPRVVAQGEPVNITAIGFDR